jgi:hypothetical protein
MNALTTSPEIEAMEKENLALKNDRDTKIAEYNNIRTSVEKELE